VTISSERYRSVVHTENFLLDLTDPKRTPVVPTRIRQMVNIVEVFQLIPPEAKYQIPLQNVQELSKMIETVFAVYLIDIDCPDELLFIFSSKEKAQEYIDNQTKDFSWNYEIREIEVR
jgi:hypothetical protein